MQRQQSMFVFIQCFPYCTSLAVLKVLQLYMKLADKFPECPLNTENVQFLMLVPTICLQKKQKQNKTKTKQKTVAKWSSYIPHTWEMW